MSSSTTATLAKQFPHIDRSVIDAIWLAAEPDIAKAKSALESISKKVTVVGTDGDDTLPICPHGAACYLRSKSHLSKFRHDAADSTMKLDTAAVAASTTVTDPAPISSRKRTSSLRIAAATAAAAAEAEAPREAPPIAKKTSKTTTTSAKVRTACEYGKECYRKNKAHRAEMSHPGDGDWADDDDKEVAVALARSASLLLHPPSSPDTYAFDDDDDAAAGAQDFVERMLAFQSGKADDADERKAKKARTSAAPKKPVVAVAAAAAVPAKPKGKIHAGRVFALTGAMSKVRTEIVREIESRGGEVKPSVTSAVTHLIAADPHSGTSKLEKARAAGIVVVGEAFIYSGDEAATVLPETTGDEDDDDFEAPADAGPPAWLVKEVTLKGIVPTHCMKSGETVTIGTYTLKRVFDHYYCTCMAWKQQKSSVDARTCKHLRDHLGAAYEAARVHGGGDASAASGVVRASDTTHDAASDVKIPTPALLLANKWTETTDPTRWHMSEKLDGVRALWTRGMLVSRNGNKFSAPAWFIEKLPKDVELDGELFGGRGKFQTAVSIARSHDSARWQELTFQVFDAPGVKGVFEERMKRLDALLGGGKCGKHVVVVAQTVCTSLEHLMTQLKTVEAAGGEGIMLRQPGSAYVGSRSSTLLKVKTFHDADAKVIAHEPGKGKYTGQCGALKCTMIGSGKEFRVGTGMSDADRINPPSVGSTIIYRYFELTLDGIPRFPVFVGLRAD
jgi:hypothetical protein